MLYIIPTPIGNKEDITLRALNLFRSVNIFLCEDTRTTKKLFKLYDIDYTNKFFHSFTSFTSPAKLNFYIDLLRSQDVGLVSEAGTPGISDPGKEIVRIARESDIAFEVLPGANALTPALVASARDSSQFVFLGFLPKKKGRNTQLKFILNSSLPVYIYESVHRVVKTLQQLKDLGFTGKVGIFRELSKMHEQKQCTDIDTALSMLSSGQVVLKGEFVLGFYNKI